MIPFQDRIDTGSYRSVASVIDDQVRLCRVKARKIAISAFRLSWEKDGARGSVDLRDARWWAKKADELESTAALLRETADELEASPVGV